MASTACSSTSSPNLWNGSTTRDSRGRSAGVGVAFRIRASRASGVAVDGTIAVLDAPLIGGARAAGQTIDAISTARRTQAATTQPVRCPLALRFEPMWCPSAGADGSGRVGSAFEGLGAGSALAVLAASSKLTPVGSAVWARSSSR